MRDKLVRRSTVGGNWREDQRLSQSWTQQSERGSNLLLRFMAWLVLTFGRPPGRFLLYPISLYFAIFSKSAAAASRQYLSIVLERRPRFSEVFRHYHTFASTIMDRLYFLTDRFDKFDVSVEGLEHVNSQIEKKQGCLLIGCHLGSFEALRSLGENEAKVPIKTLYYKHNSQRIDALLNQLNPAAAEQVIHIGSPNSMIEVKEFVEQGGCVGLLGDRSFGGGRVVEVDFLGRPAPFPVWPMRLAGAIKVPVFLFFALYKGGRRYEIIFEPFEIAPPAAQTTGKAHLRDLVARYAGRVEYHCRRAPYNWFNFYDFWDPSVDRA